MTDRGFHSPPLFGRLTKNTVGGIIFAVASAAAFLKAKAGSEIMPFFEYKCRKCGKIFEEYVKKFDDEVKCPDCGETAEKNYSGAVYSSTGAKKINCTGNCKTCGGCK